MSGAEDSGGKTNVSEPTQCSTIDTTVTLSDDDDVDDN